MPEHRDLASPAPFSSIRWKYFHERRKNRNVGDHASQRSICIYPKMGRADTCFMKIRYTTLFLCFIVFGASLAMSQNKSGGDGTLMSKSKKETGPSFRYVVVYDDLQTEESDDGRKIPLTRFVRVLINEKDFSESNLIVLFNYLSKYYLVPTYLNIEVHTSLETLETLEERAKMSTNDIGRSEFYQIHKTAGYSRFFDGKEIFSYDSGAPGQFMRKHVNLGTTKVNDTNR